LNHSTRFGLWHNLYVIFAIGQYKGVKFACRCYIKCIAGRVEAVISGGSYRKAAQNRALVMDGSHSRDYSKMPKAEQFKVYTWSCVAVHEFKNPQCYYNMSTEKRFTIPAESFTLHYEYKFTLRVVSDYDPRVSSSSEQLVEMVDFAVLLVAIVCIDNCEHGTYNPKGKVQLSGECLNCGNREPKFEWYVDNNLTLESKLFTATLKAYGTIAVVELRVTASDGRKGQEVRNMFKRVAPISGTCSVKPTSGIEATTYFDLCCKNFETKSQPIEYFFYSNKVLLTKCHSCDCGVYLSLNTYYIQVLICDVLLTCRPMSLGVSVRPLQKPEIGTPEQLEKKIRSDPYNVVQDAEMGNLDRFTAVIQALAGRIRSVEHAKVLIDAYTHVYPRALQSLGQIANLTTTLALKLTPIDTAEHETLVRAVTKLNEVFANAYKDDKAKLLVLQPYVDVGVACNTVYKMMERLEKALIRPPQKVYDRFVRAFHNGTLSKKMVDEMIAEVSQYEDEFARNRSILWLQSRWQTERLFRFLYYGRQHSVPSEDLGITSETVAMDIECMEIEPNRNYQMESGDHMHKVLFTAALLRDMKSPDTNHICLQVISIIRELNWWFPEEKQPSAVLLSVRIFVTKDEFKHEIDLPNSDISFRTSVGKFKPGYDTSDLENRDFDFEEDMDLVADTGKYINNVVTSELEFMQHVRVYRINLDELTLVAVRFTSSTHDLQVLLSIAKPPRQLRKALEESICFVPANSRNTTMLIRNKCPKLERVYMAVQVSGAGAFKDNPNMLVPDGPARFSFVFQQRSCASWRYREKEWSHAKCLPTLENQIKGTLHCTCTVLGTYTSYVFHIPATIVPIKQVVALQVNWYLAAIYLLIYVGLIAWVVILFIWCSKRPSRTVICDMGDQENESHRDIHDILVFLNTGGRVNAETTATVRLIFLTVQHTEMQVTVMQNPEEPVLKRNSTYVLWLRTRDIRVPTRIAVSHNSAGRYPSWYLVSIEVVDVQAHLMQVFIVRRWVRTKFLILSSAMVLREGSHRVAESWCRRFKTEFERQWINWGLWQPVTGEWRDSKNSDGMSRFQRVCVFISKIVITLCVCLVYQGPTTELIKIDDSTVASPYDILLMFLICLVATNVVHYMFEYLLMEKK
ncbi:hypothetical protein KR222_005127, partial [Zaprionus bogoriensis]